MLYTLCWELSGSVFQVFIKNVYVSATPGEVDNLGPVAAGCVLTTVILMIEEVRVIRSVHFQL